MYHNVFHVMFISLLLLGHGRFNLTRCAFTEKVASGADKQREVFALDVSQFLCNSVTISVRSEILYTLLEAIKLKVCTFHCISPKYFSHTEVNPGEYQNM